MIRFSALLLLLAIAGACVSHRAVQVVPSNPSTDSIPVNAFRAYARIVEARIEADGPAANFLRFAQDAQARAQLREGEILTRPASALGIEPSAATPDWQVQHWVGAMFLPGATLANAIPRLQNYNDRKRYMWPEVVESRQLGRRGSTFQVYLRLSEKSVVSGVFDVYLAIVYRMLDPTHLLIESRSVRIAEVAGVDAAEGSAARDRGLLWGLNHYWRIAESDGGLYVECEALVLSRRPPGLTQLIADPLIAQAARKTLAGTLEATRRIVESER